MLPNCIYTHFTHFTPFHTHTHRHVATGNFWCCCCVLFFIFNAYQKFTYTFFCMCFNFCFYYLFICFSLSNFSHVSNKATKFAIIKYAHCFIFANSKCTHSYINVCKCVISLQLKTHFKC